MRGLRRRFLLAMGLPISALACEPKEAGPTEVVLAPTATSAAGVDAATKATKAPTDPSNAPAWQATYAVGHSPGCQPTTATATCFLLADISNRSACAPSIVYRDAELSEAGAATAQETEKKKSAVCCYGEPAECKRYIRGRSFDGGVTAPTTRGDWRGEPAPDAPHVDWEAMAAAEHASIASFARATLELLALGAPPDLVADTHRAALDEIEHARFAYAMASARAGRAIGPAPLEAAAAPIPTPTLAGFAVTTFRAACVAETVGALELHHDATRAPPALRARLLRIADDEERHAELAWRTLAWAVRRGGTAVREALHEEMASLHATHELEARAHAEIVRPCAGALLDEAS